MSPARIMPSHRSQLLTLRKSLELTEVSPETRALVPLICRDMLDTIGEEVAQATTGHPQSTSRRELLNLTVHSAVLEFSHLIDQQNPAPRCVSRLMQRMGRAEADAGWELDVVLVALETLHTSWWRAANRWTTTVGASVSHHVGCAFTGYLAALHHHAVTGQTSAFRATPIGASNPRNPRPEVAMMQVVDVWRDNVTAFDVTVRPREGLQMPARMGHHDHDAHVLPHAEASEWRPEPGPSVRIEAIAADDVLDAYRECLLGLRLMENGLVAPSSLTLSSFSLSRAPLHPGANAVYDAANRLDFLTSLGPDDRVSRAEALQSHLLEHLPGVHVPAARHSPHLGDDLDDLAGMRLATLAALRLAVPLWQQELAERSA